MGISALLAAQILDASATGRSVLTGADASAIRSTLGLGTLATQSPTGTPSASTFLRGDYSWQTIDLSGYLPLAGGTMTGAINVPLGAASAESIRFASNTGLYSAGDGFLNFNGNGMMQWNGAAGQLWLAVNSATTQIAMGSSADVRLFRDSANTLAQRNATNAQTFRIYNTFTDASNYERGFARWNSNVFEIGAEAAGTGTQRQLAFPLGTVTASTPLSITQTWNNAATTFTGILANVTDTASNAASLLLDLQVGGTSRFNVQKDGQLRIASLSGLSPIGSSAGIYVYNNTTTPVFFRNNSAEQRAWLTNIGFSISSTYAFSWSFDGTTYSTPDLYLYRDAANTLAQRNSTNAQTFRIYNTYTDSSNYERAKIAWESNVLRIGTEKAGTGSARALELQTDGTTRLTIASTGLATFSGKGVFTGAGDCLTLIRTGLCSFSLGDANGDTFRIQNAGDNSDMLRIHGTTKLVTLYGNLDVGTRNLVTDTTTGTKIGTATTQKLGFYGATPVDQPATVSDAATQDLTGSDTVDRVKVEADLTSCKTAINAIIDRLQELGLIA